MCLLPPLSFLRPFHAKRRRRQEEEPRRIRRGSSFKLDSLNPVDVELDIICQDSCRRGPCYGRFRPESIVRISGHNLSTGTGVDIGFCVGCNLRVIRKGRNTDAVVNLIEFFGEIIQDFTTVLPRNGRIDSEAGW